MSFTLGAAPTQTATTSPRHAGRGRQSLRLREKKKTVAAKTSVKSPVPTPTEDGDEASFWDSLPPLNDAHVERAVRAVSLGPDADVVRPLLNSTVIDAFANVPKPHDRPDVEPYRDDPADEYDPPESIFKRVPLLHLDLGDSFILADAIPDEATAWQREEPWWPSPEDEEEAEEEEEEEDVARGVAETKHEDEEEKKKKKKLKPKKNLIREGLRQVDRAQKDPRLIDEFIKSVDHEKHETEWPSVSASSSEEDEHVRMGKEFVAGMKQRGEWPPQRPTEKEVADAMRAAEAGVFKKKQDTTSSNPTDPTDDASSPFQSTSSDDDAQKDDLRKALEAQLGHDLDNPPPPRKWYTADDEAEARRVYEKTSITYTEDDDYAKNNDKNYDPKASYFATPRFSRDARQPKRGDSVRFPAAYGDPSALEDPIGTNDEPGTAASTPEFYQQTAREIFDFSKEHHGEFDDPEG